MSSVPHQSNILRCTVHTLSILYGPLKHVAEFRLRPEVVRPDEINHAPDVLNRKNQISLPSASRELIVTYSTNPLQKTNIWTREKPR